MEMLPFGKGASDIIWALPFLGLIIFALAMSGLVVGLIANPCSHTGWQIRDHRLVSNGVALAIWLWVASSFRPSA
jgi:hypothetical protein